ncbi:MAG TPA: alpha/beta hydrolase [Blastococcus sp.]|jgi:pimeloyl-ACP methyl ester carboxylesterase|nr:alpha/beta hydrolase [Blastococcus sp.]
MPTERDVAVDGVTLRVRVWPAVVPAGPPVVLLPATGETAEDWDVVAASLQESRTVHAVSLRGHGSSDWPGNYSIQAMADDVTGLLRQLDGPVDLVGHSLGGLVACAVASAHPELVRRLVLEDVGVPPPRPAAAPPRPAGVLPFDWRAVEQVRPEIDDPDPRWRDVVAGISAPTLVIAGGPSSPVPQDSVAELAGLVPDGGLVTVDTGHLVHETRPVDFTGHLLTFLDR